MCVKVNHTRLDHGTTSCNDEWNAAVIRRFLVQKTETLRPCMHWGACCDERLVSRDMSQRQETPIHPSTFPVTTSQKEGLLTCAAYITIHLAEKKSKGKKNMWLRKFLEERNRRGVL
jgi:hypothetical protein